MKRVSIDRRLTTRSQSRMLPGAKERTYVHNPHARDNYPDTCSIYCRSHRLRAGPLETVCSGGIWERLHYDWSDPNHVVLTTTDSNTWGGASGHTYTFTQRSDGLTDIDLVTVRDGKNLKGRLLGLVVGTVGKGVLVNAFKNSVKAIEARNGASREAGAA